MPKKIVTKKAEPKPAPKAEPAKSNVPVMEEIVDALKVLQASFKNLSARVDDLCKVEAGAPCEEKTVIDKTKMLKLFKGANGDSKPLLKEIIKAL